MGQPFNVFINREVTSQRTLYENYESVVVRPQIAGSIYKFYGRHEDKAVGCRLVVYIS